MTSHRKWPPSKETKPKLWKEEMKAVYKGVWKQHALQKKKKKKQLTFSFMPKWGTFHCQCKRLYQASIGMTQSKRQSVRVWLKSWKTPHIQGMQVYMYHLFALTHKWMTWKLSQTLQPEGRVFVEVEVLMWAQGGRCSVVNRLLHCSGMCDGGAGSFVGKLMETRLDPVWN